MTVEERLAVAEVNIARLSEETAKTRERLHTLESDRATVRQLVQQFGEFRDAMADVAKRAAEETLELALQTREELNRGRWQLRGQWIGVGVAFGGFVVLLADKLNP